MVKTYGLTHIALAVKDAKKSFEFYRKGATQVDLVVGGFRA